MAHSTQSLADPAGASVLVAAVQWLQGTLLGTIATTVVIIAVATMGLMMLSGRIDWKRGVSVVIGCFILFGASSIVAGIRAAGGIEEAEPVSAVSVPMMAAPPAVELRPPATPYDPYAGAAVPTG